MKKKYLGGIAAGLMVLVLAGISKASLFVDDEGTYKDLEKYDSLVTAITTEDFEKIVGKGTAPADELKWINSALKSSYIIDDYEKTNNSVTGWSDMWKQVYSSILPEATKADPIGFAFELTGRPDYFMIKLGGKKANVNYLLFKNDSNFDWAAIQLSGSGYTIENFGTISHIDQIGSAPVPEPATILLFGTGIAGLVAARRRKKTC